MLPWLLALALAQEASSEVAQTPPAETEEAPAELIPGVRNAGLPPSAPDRLGQLKATPIEDLQTAPLPMVAGLPEPPAAIQVLSGLPAPPPPIQQAGLPPPPPPLPVIGAELPPGAKIIVFPAEEPPPEHGE